MFSCIICNVCATDDLDELERHLNVDRSATTNVEHVTITAENGYLCNLCQYKTNLKANFQLHCKVRWCCGASDFFTVAGSSSWQDNAERNNLHN